MVPTPIGCLGRDRGLDRRVCGDVQVLPIRDGSFDLVTANMVVEHVAQPEGLFREVHRVLTANGRFVVHTPNRAGYSTALTRMIPNEKRGGLARVLLQRDERDVYPTFYRANRERDLRRMAQQSGLTMVECQYLESSAQTIAVPPLMVAELLLVRALRVLRAARFRPCLLATFTK